MTKLTTALAGFVTALLVLSAPSAHAVDGPEIDITDVDSSGYPTVTAVVSAPPGLDGVAFPIEAFEVLEAAAPVAFTVERVPADFEIMLVVDTSGSMEGAPLAAAKAAATEFIALLPLETKVGVVAFGTTPSLAAAPSTDRTVVTREIDGLESAGDTALHDAVIFAASQFTPGPGERAVVLLSDGGDTSSVAPLEEATAAATELNMHVIELVSDQSNRVALEQLAAAGGGSVSSASDPAGLGALYRNAASALLNRYRISYTSAGTGAVELRVRLASQGTTLEAATTVELPAAPATTVAPTTVAPSTVAPTTVAPTTVAPATVSPSTVAPATSVPPTRETVATDERGSLTLLIGAGAFFFAFLVLGLVLFLGDRRRRLVRAHLGLEDRVRGQNMTQLKGNVTAAADRLLEQHDKARSLAMALEVAGIAVRPGEFLALTFTVALVVALAGLSVVGPLGLVGAVIVPLAARILVARLAARRRAKFAELLPDNLQLMTSSLKSGYGLLPSLDNVAQEAAEPAGSEFRRVLLEIRVGRDVGDALRALSGRMASKDFEWVVGAIEINREVGGDLSMILEHVAETIRERQRLSRQVSALTAEGRLSAYILTALPLVLALALAVINPDYLARLGSGVGLVLVGIGGGLILAGWIWMQRLIRTDY